MKKAFLYFLLVIAIITSCSPRKNRFTNRAYQRFSSYYNTLFNAEQAIEIEKKERKEINKDNFYGQFINILPHDNLYIKEKSFNYDVLDEEEEANFNNDDEEEEENLKASQLLQLAEYKSQKIIDKRSMLFTGGEKNRMVFDAYMMITISKLYQDQPYDALNSLNYIFTNMKNDKRFPIAKIYEAVCYSKLKDYYKATELFIELEKTKIPKKYKSIFYIYYAENLLLDGEKEKSIEKLELAFAANKDRQIKSRIAYLRGQILASLGKNKDAKESFVTAYKLSNDFEFQVKSLIEIANNFDPKTDNYQEVADYITKNSKKGIFKSKRNELYYALGVLSNKAGKPDEAIEYFKKSLEGEPSDPQIRGQAYYEIGKSFFDKDDYIKAGKYYDSALVFMDYEPKKIELKKHNEEIKTFSKSYYLMKRNDSVLTLVNMSEDQRKDYFSKFIKDLQEKEKQEKIEEENTKKKKQIEADVIAANNAQSPFNVSKNTFYFANSSTVAKGTENFKKTWGNRALVDNWRYSIKNITAEEQASEVAETIQPANPRRFEVEFYTEKIPSDKKDILKLKKDLDSASLDVGRMYHEFFYNTPLASKTLYKVASFTENKETKLQALYMVFILNYEKNPQEAELAKNIILQEFGDTPYAEFVKNPKSSVFTKSNNEVEQSYDKAYELYTDEKYKESLEIIEESLSKYEKDALLPKFELLKAFNQGKISGGKEFLKALRRVHALYPRSDEGRKANELYKYLKEKSELVKEIKEEEEINPNEEETPVEEVQEQTNS